RTAGYGRAGPRRRGVGSRACARDHRAAGRGVMAYAVGVTLFVLGILISITLHEYGHFRTARAFGMKVTRFFIGFGPTLWSFRRGETEYGVKGIPAGAFVKIIGMTPEDDDVPPGEEHRAMWRYPVWKRTIVLGAGSAVHFVLGFVILWAVLAFFPVAEPLDTAPPTVHEVATCVVLEWEIDPDTGTLRECGPGSGQASAAVAAGLRPGDTITSINGEPVTQWQELTALIRAAGGETVALTFERDGRELTAAVTLPVAERLREDLDPLTPVTEITEADLEEVGVLGIQPVIPQTTIGPVGAVGEAVDRTGAFFTGTVEALSHLPERIPDLWAAVFGAERSPETPISVVGASRIGGDLWARGEVPTFLVLLAALNFFVGVFNLVPLLPLDGGHIAIAWF